MSEFSLFWTTGTTGDGATTYTDTQLFSWLRRTFNSDMSADRGPLKGYNGELAVTAGAGKVMVATGAAYVYGIPYENDASVDVTIPTPTANTRIDRIVLRANWTTKTVRITRIAGTEGAGAPAITQNPGSVYDVKLAQVSITTGGVITVTDERQFCRFATEAAEENIADGAVTTPKLADGAVTAAKISGGAVDTSMLADGAVTSAKIANGTIVDADISSSAAIAQSKISNAARAIDADLLDGQHGSYYASVSSLTAHSSATTNVHGLPAATSLVGSKQGTLRLEVQSHTRTGLLNGGHDFSVEWSSPFSSAPKVWVWMEKTGGSSTVNPGWYARSLGGPTTTGHSVRISVDDWPGDGKSYTLTVYFLAIGS